MDKVTFVKSQLKLEHWRKLIAECQSSGMTVKQWCAQNGISKDQYYYWLRKVREATIENLPVKATNLPSSTKQENITFKPLEVKPLVSVMQAAVTVHLPQATVKIAGGTDQQYITIENKCNSICNTSIHNT